jgi:hypothetical protein
MYKNVYSEIDLAEYFALESAFRFMVGQDWNMDDYITKASKNYKFDRDLVWLATNVLFAPAVVYTACGKNV